jgi:hypothetical protein
MRVENLSTLSTYLITSDITSYCYKEEQYEGHRSQISFPHPLWKTYPPFSHFL